MENERQLMHFLVGLIAIALLFLVGNLFTRAIVFFVIIIGTILINAKIQGHKIGFVNWFVDKFERKNVLFPGFGSAVYALGVLIPLVFLEDPNQVAAVIFVLAVGDGMSTIVGKMGKIRIPYNKNKTVEGSFAFFLSSLGAFIFVGPAVVFLAAITTVAESLPLRIDDNLIIPIVATALFLL